MYLTRPVRIPEIPKRILYRKYKDRRYVVYITGWRYDKWRQFDLVNRVNIGIQIPARPEYMMPNENYFKYILEGDRKMNEKEQEALEEFERERDRAYLVRDFFEQHFYAFQFSSQRQPDTVVNEYKVKELNSILEPMREMMKDEPAAEWLKLIPLPTEETLEGGGTILRGRTYSDVMMLLTRYRCAEGEYFQKLLLK